MEKNDEQLSILRHSCEHVMHQAMVELFPGLKRAMGPATKEGFYLDFDYDGKVTEEDFPKIEKRMQEIIKANLPLIREEVSLKKAREMFKDNPYKLEWIDEAEKNGQKAIIYWAGEPGKPGSDYDFCKGPHVKSTSEVGPFKLLSVAGAYWHGSEKNKMLTRIYGTCFQTQKELDDYLNMLEEAKKRDHRKIGKELELFSFHEEGPGFVFWHPKGMLIRESLMNLYNDLHKKAGYQLVSTPMLLSEDLWHKSGHWDHYKDHMYFTKIDGRTFAIKPMNCPGVSLIYKNRPRSYKELPLRLAEAGEVHRHEPSGTLHGLLRVRAFRQDDAHIFATENQIEDEIKNIILLTLEFYKLIGFSNVHIELSTRPENSIGGDEIWEKAENILKKVLKDLNLQYQLNKGDGAFYGPKIDFHIEDVIGRSWQCGTIQLDFFMPERFELEYIDKDGLPKRPIMIHRTVIGSIQRFVGILIEHFGGAFPAWLSPVQVQIIPITDRNNKYGQKVLEYLKSSNIRAELDDRSEKMQGKIRDAQLQKIPYMLIIGDREEKEGKVAIRTRDGKDLGVMNLDKFIELITDKISNKSLDLS